MALQSNGNEEENVKDAVASDEDNAPDSSNGKPKRRGRAARRRRREEAQDTAENTETDIDASSQKKGVPTPGRRQKEQVGFLTRIFRPVVTYFQETMAELRKVTWPSREDSIRLSGIVLGVTAASAVFLGLYTFLLDRLLGLVLRLF